MTSMDGVQDVSLKPRAASRSIVTLLSDASDRVTQILYILVTFSFAAIMLLGVIFRYALDAPIYWSDEVALMCFVWAAFLSIATAYLHDQHIRIDFVLRKLSPRALAAIEPLAAGLAGGYIACLLLSAVDAVAFFSRVRSDALQIPLIVGFSAVPVCSTLMLLHWLRRVCETPPTSRVLSIAIAVLTFSAIYFQFGHWLKIAGHLQAFLLTVSFFAPLLIGMPVAIAIGLLATTYYSMSQAVSFDLLTSQIFYGIDSVVLMAIPLLILAGGIMHAGGIAERLVEFAQVLVGRLRGGLGASNVLASYIFGDISGSSVSDTAAIGALMIPEMKKRGYQPAFCAALQGAAGTLGMMAPLSITILLYASAMNISVSRLAVATIIPATLVMLSFMAYVLWHGRRHNYPQERVPRNEVNRRILRAIPGLMALVLILGGILGGVFTPAEVGAVLLAYVMILTIVLQRSISWSGLLRIVIEAGFISGMTLFLVGTSSLLGYILALNEMGGILKSAMASVADQRFIVILAATAAFIVLGMFLEAPAIIFGFLPSFIPLLQHAKVDPIHWGVLFVINMGLGMIVPPIAVNLFVSTKLADVSYEKTVVATVPFMIIMFVDLVIVAAFPTIALILPHAIFSYPM